MKLNNIKNNFIRRKTEMKKMLLVSLMLCFAVSDEFFEPTTTIGGYGEMHYDMEANNGDGKLDFHRYIFYIKHQFNP